MFAISNIMSFNNVKIKQEVGSNRSAFLQSDLIVLLLRDNFAFWRKSSMDYISISEVSREWGVSTRRVQVLCAQGRIPGACRIGNIWAIPRNAQKPSDARVRSGKYIKDKEN